MGDFISCCEIHAGEMPSVVLSLTALFTTALSHASKKGSQHSLMQAKNRAKARIPLPEASFIPAKQARDTDASA